MATIAATSRMFPTKFAISFIVATPMVLPPTCLAAPHDRATALKTLAVARSRRNLRNRDHGSRPRHSFSQKSDPLQGLSIHPRQLSRAAELSHSPKSLFSAAMRSMEPHHSPVDRTHAPVWISLGRLACRIQLSPGRYIEGSSRSPSTAYGAARFDHLRRACENPVVSRPFDKRARPSDRTIESNARTRGRATHRKSHRKGSQSVSLCQDRPVGCLCLPGPRSWQHCPGGLETYGSDNAKIERQTLEGYFPGGTQSWSLLQPTSFRHKESNHPQSHRASVYQRGTATRLGSKNPWCRGPRTAPATQL